MSELSVSTWNAVKKVGQCCLSQPNVVNRVSIDYLPNPWSPMTAATATRGFFPSRPRRGERAIGCRPVKSFCQGPAGFRPRTCRCAHCSSSTTARCGWSGQDRGAMVRFAILGVGESLRRDVVRDNTPTSARVIAGRRRPGSGSSIRPRRYADPSRPGFRRPSLPSMPRSSPSGSPDVRWGLRRHAWG